MYPNITVCLLKICINIHLHEKKSKRWIKFIFQKMLPISPNTVSVRQISRTTRLKIGRLSLEVLVYFSDYRVSNFLILEPVLINTCVKHFNIGIKHGFSCINIHQVPWEVLKTEAEGIKKPCSIAIIA